MFRQWDVTDPLRAADVTRLQLQDGSSRRPAVPELPLPLDCLAREVRNYPRALAMAQTSAHRIARQPDQAGCRVYLVPSENGSHSSEFRLLDHKQRGAPCKPAGWSRHPGPCWSRARPAVRTRRGRVQSACARRRTSLRSGPRAKERQRRVRAVGLAGGVTRAGAMRSFAHPLMSSGSRDLH